MDMQEPGRRAEELAQRLEQASTAVIARVESCSETAWHALCPNEHRSVGVMVHHIAVSAPVVAGWAYQIATGQDAPLVTMDLLNGTNAAHAAEHANPEKTETIALLRRNTLTATQIIRQLTNEQLDRTAPFALFGGQPTSAQMVIELVLIGHVHGYPHSHLPNVEAALRA